MTDPSQDKFQNRHDKLFKTVFSDPKDAASFFQNYLPEKLVATMDWASLTLIDKEFIDEEFKSSESDLLYQVRLNETDEEVFLYLLFEHQSTPDKWLRFRLLKYCCRIWDNSFREFSDQQFLKPILPVVFYQGQRKWNYSTQFLDLIEHDPLNVEFLPHFNHFLVDQSGYELEQFKGETKAQIAQLLLKTAFHGQIQQALKQFARLLVQVESTGGFDYIEFFILYLVEAHEELTTDDIVQAIVQETHSQELGDKAMTLADRLRTEGRIEGLEKGLEKGVLIGEIRTFQRMLKQPQSSQEELRQKDSQELNAILEELENQFSSK